MNHGTEWAYRQQCRCDDCRAAQSRRTRERRYRTRDNGVELIDPEPAQLHLAYLQSVGMSNGAIADCSGVPVRTLWTLNNHRGTHVQRRIANAVLGVMAAEAPADHRCKVNAAPAKKLVEAMLGAGISWAVLRDTYRVTNPHRVGVRHKNVSLLTHKRIVLAYTHLARQGRVPASLLEEVDL